MNLSTTLKAGFKRNKDKNAHRFVLSGDLSEREREKERESNNK